MESSSGLKLYWQILKRRSLPAIVVFVVVLAIAALGTTLRKPTYLAEGTLKFERTSPTSSLTGVGKEIGNLEPLVEKSSPVATEAEIIRSTPVIQKTINELRLRDKKGSPLKPKEFLKRLTVVEIRGTDVLKISYKDTDSKRAATVVNTLMTAYLEKNVLSHRMQAATARKFIERELPAAEAAVNQVEEALRRFKKNHQVVALKEEASAAVSMLTDLQKQVAATQTQITDSKSQAQIFQNKLRGTDSQEAVDLAALSQSPGVQEVLDQLQQTESQLAVERDRLQDTHPQIVALEGKRKQLKGVLQKQIGQVLGNQSKVPTGNLQAGTVHQDFTKELVLLEAKRQGLADQLVTLNQTQAAYRQRANTLPKLEKEQRELERKLEAAQTTYSQLLQKMGEIRVAENQNVGNARIVSPAQIPDTPISSLHLYVAAVLASILAAVATVYGLEASDRSLKTVEQARNLFGFTLLGVIPTIGKPRKARVRHLDMELMPEAEVGEMLDSPAGVASAPYPMIQANLKFLSCDRTLKSIVITSSVPREGKSTVSANLALTMAQLGRKVLLVDANLQHPMQHRIWELTNDVGLSNAILGQTELRNSIRTVRENLDVLSSGMKPSNSLALLDSQQMAVLVQNLVVDYEFVIIDTPSLNFAADALVLGKLADGVLLVVRPEQVDSSSAAVSKELLQQSNQNVLGMVLNGIGTQDDSRNHYYFTDMDDSRAGSTNV